MERTPESILQALRDFNPTAPRGTLHDPLPSWAVYFDSMAGAWALTEPAQIILDLYKTGPNLDALQTDLHAWATATYGPQTMERRGLVLGEEVGEVQRVILKTAEGTRPSTRGDLGEELAQLIVAILVTAELGGIKLSSVLPRVIAKLKARTVERDPAPAGRSCDPR